LGTTRYGNAISSRAMIRGGLPQRARGEVTQKSRFNKTNSCRATGRAELEIEEVEWVPVDRSVLDCSGSLVVDASEHHNLHRERGGWSTMYVKGEVKDGELPR